MNQVKQESHLIMGDHQDSDSLENLMSKNLQLNENTDGFVTQINIDDEDHQQQMPEVIDLTTLTTNNLLDNSEATFASASVIVEQRDEGGRRDSNLSSRSVLMPPRVEFSEKIKSASKVFESNMIQENQNEPSPAVNRFGLNLTELAGDDEHLFNPLAHHEPKANPNSPDLKTFRTHNQQQQGAGESEFMQSSYRTSNSKQAAKNQTSSMNSHRQYMAQYQSLVNGDPATNDEDLLLSAKYREQRRHYNRQADKALNTNLPDIYLGNKFPKRKTFSNKRFYVKYVANKVEKNNEFVNMLRMSSMSSFSSSSMTKTKRRRQQAVTVSDTSNPSREAFYSPAKSVASNFKPSELNKPAGKSTSQKTKSKQSRGNQQQQSALAEPILINNVIDLNFIGDKSRLESHFMMPASRRHLSELHLSDAWPRSNMCSVKTNPWVSSFKARTYANEINSTFRTPATAANPPVTVAPANPSYLMKRTLSFRTAHGAAAKAYTSQPRLYAGGENVNLRGAQRIMHHVRLKA